MKMTIEDLIITALTEINSADADSEVKQTLQAILARALRSVYDNTGTAMLVRKKSGQLLVPKSGSPTDIHDEMAFRTNRGETILGYAIREE